MVIHRPAGVDFFDRQHSARGTTVKLVVLFALAVVSIVAAIDLIVLVALRNGTRSNITAALIGASVVTLLIITGGTISKMVALRAGGSAVALSVGAVPVDPTSSDPQLRRFTNIVEEMSIASGVPVPRLFVLEQEDGINAFAAGFGPADAAITVTAGALQNLNRDELQSVIGHEFSHVLNGDMRLNVRLIGLLNGILLLGLVGLRVLYFGGGRDRGKAAFPLLAFAIGMLVVGFIGQFFAGLIKAAVARQREWLADASAVQFTRQTSGLAGALKKIAGLPSGSTLHNAHSEKQVSHMLFGEGSASFAKLWATHPPLLERIQALDPGFQQDELEHLEQGSHESALSGPAGADQVAQAARLTQLAAAMAAADPPAGPSGSRDALGQSAAFDPRALAAMVGMFTPANLDRGALLSAQMPPHLRQLASQHSTAVPLALALLLDRDTAIRDRQLTLIAQQVSPGDAAAAAALVPSVTTVPPLLRIPLVGIAVTALSARPRQQVQALLPVLDRLAAADGTITVFEYCLTRLVASYLRDSLDPARRARPGRAVVSDLQSAALTLLAVVAAAGHDDPAAAARAFATGVARLGVAPQPYTPPRDFVTALDGVWGPLDSLDPLHKRPLIEALVAAVSDDGVLAVAEAELLRTSCALLHCPLPALVA